MRRRPKSSRGAESENSDVERSDDDWMEQELKKARENLKIEEKTRTPTSPATGLKLTHEDTSGRASSGSRRHHSHHRSHRKRTTEREG